MERLKDRINSGRLLARELTKLSLPLDQVVVLGLARGGVPVACSLAKELGVALDVLAVRKLGVPQQPELALGAIAPDGVRVLNKEIVSSMEITADSIERIEKSERALLDARNARYHATHPTAEISDKIVILVDDGLATGATLRASLLWAHQHGARDILVAVPVGSREACDELVHHPECTACICSLKPAKFNSVGEWYENFDQVSDDTVMTLLASFRDKQALVT